MQIATATLQARSQAQAFDWSLVLISQGIESTVQRTEDGTWVLEVPQSDSLRAEQSIAAYEQENRTVWRHELKGTGLLFDGRVIPFYLLLALFWPVTEAHPEWKSAGLVIRDQITQGEWWRLVTGVTLHADLAHLAANVTTGIVLTGLAMGCMGMGHALLLSLLGGVLGNVISMALRDGSIASLGASGMVMASLGLLTAHSFITARQEKASLLVGRGVVAGCLLVVLLGLSPKSDVVAHVGGFAGGIVLGLIAMQFRTLLFRRSSNAISFVLTWLVIVGAWWLTLR